jgi:hypothetical protein
VARVVPEVKAPVAQLLTIDVRCDSCGAITDLSLHSRCQRCGRTLPLPEGSYELEQGEETPPEKERPVPIQRQIARAEKRIRKAKRKPVPKTGPILLFLIAVLLLPAGIGYLSSDARRLGMGILETFGIGYILVSLVMVGLGVWSLRQPLPPVVIAAVVLFVFTFIEVVCIARLSTEPKVTAVTPWYAVTVKTRPNFLALAVRLAVIVGLVRAAVEAKEKGGG